MKSMTGYGKYTTTTTFGTITIELKSVNHRYLNISYRANHVFSAHEFQVVQYVKKYLYRGSVRINISFTPAREGALNQLIINEDLARQYYEALTLLKERYSLPHEIIPGDFLHCPELFILEDKDNPELNTQLMEALAQSLQNFNEYRQREGQELQQHLQKVLNQMSVLVSTIEEESENVLPLTLDKFRKRLAQFSREIPQVPEERLIQEALFLCDKADISEELNRLSAHLKEIERSFHDDTPVGKKLDFIAQECFREVNTISSKVSQYSAVKTALALKSEVDKLREQIQNIE